MPSRGARIFAWTGAALFAGSLLYFLYTYLVTFGETPRDLRVGPRTAVLWDVLLFTIFAIHHSVFARDTLRRGIKRLAGAELERSLYVWIASLLFIAVCAAWLPIAGQMWALDGMPAWLLHAVQLVGIWLTLRSAVIIDAFELAGVRQVSADNAARTSSGPRAETRDSPEFKTTGPYGWVRHPIYLGWFFVVFAVPTMTMTRMVFAVTSSVYLVVAIPFEERSLLAATGDAYREYMRQVRWRIVPGVY